MKKKRILTLVTIASISALAVTGCKKTGNDVKNNQENMTIESTNDLEDQETDESGVSGDTIPEGQTDSSEEQANTDNEEVTGEDSTTKDSQETTTNEADKDSSKGTSKAEVELPIYTINDESLETEDAIAYVSADTKITAEVIVDEVVKAFSANSYEVKIDSVSQDGDTVVVNFKKNSAPVTGVGASVEVTTLDCISYSLLDNLSTCKKVIFRVEGEAYASGHIELGINEPYSTGNEN
jgi:hypothetical protein